MYCAVKIWSGVEENASEGLADFMCCDRIDGNISSVVNGGLLLGNVEPKEPIDKA
jgi:hypothetical protein